MRKVRLSKQMRLKPQKPGETMLKINRPNNNMVNKELLKNKIGGTTLKDYSLDKMKLR